jgi:hypothetical protein
MKVWELSLTYAGWAESPPLVARASSLHLVGPQELSELERSLTRGQLPLDFETKLQGLAAGDLIRSSIDQHCRIFIELLKASYGGHFKEATAAERERLLRVLAYVRKDEDAIADYKPNGFVDDLQEVRAAVREMEPLLCRFKAWRLLHQVPGMWSLN